jgi:Ser/Thr protein kinase RdoA (MazF antagonist)
MADAMTTTVEFLALPVEEQLERATRAARAALGRYALPADAGLDVLKHRENTVFAVRDAAGRGLAALRVHVPGYQDRTSIESELAWMRALESAGVRPPRVLPARDGAAVVAVPVPGAAETRLVDALEWIDGREPAADELVGCFRTLGELHARCHTHAAHWQVPAGFRRQRWDESTLLAGVHPVVAPAWENWALDAAQRDRVLASRDALAARLAAWGKDRERYGIIHSDLMPDNLLLTADGVRIVDFDDAGFGWYLYDPASALLYYHGSDLYDPLLASWREGYRAVRPLADGEVAELPTFLLLRCFYALGWLHLRRNSPWAEAFNGPVIGATMALSAEVIGRD